MPTVPCRVTCGFTVVLITAQAETRLPFMVPHCVFTCLLDKPAITLEQEPPDTPHLELFQNSLSKYGCILRCYRLERQL